MFFSADSIVCNLISQTTNLKYMSTAKEPSKNVTFNKKKFGGHILT